MAAAPEAPYCGAPPGPGAVAWNLDPVLIAALAAAGALYALAFAYQAQSTTEGRISFKGQTSFALGWALLGFLLISPLCNLSVALFSARVAQHVLIALVAAPLIALGLPPRASPRTASKNPRDTRGGERALFAWSGIFAVVLWTWHLPGPYEAALKSTPVYWIMQASIIASAVLFWRALLNAGASALAMLCALATAMQMSLLGALLTFAPRALFAAHATTTQVWGLSTLEDQQLGGMIMWVPGGLLFALLAVIHFACALTRPARRPHENNARLAIETPR